MDMVQVNFTEDEMADFLLARGYVICVRSAEHEVNIYQNRFITEHEIVVEAINDDVTELLKESFEKEFKQHLLSI